MQYRLNLRRIVININAQNLSEITVDLKLPNEVLQIELCLICATSNKA